MAGKLKDKAKKSYGPRWYERAKRNVATGSELITPKGLATMRTMSYSTDKGHFIAPSIREIGGKLVTLKSHQVQREAERRGDALGPFKSIKEADRESKRLSKSLDVYRRKVRGR